MKIHLNIKMISIFCCSFLLIKTDLITDQIRENCQSIEEFNEENKNESTEHKIFDLQILFKKANKISKVKREVAKINGIKGFNEELAVKKVSLKNYDPEIEIEILLKVKGKNGFTQLKKCVYDTDEQSIYLFFEKFLKDLSSKNFKDFKKKNIQRDRLKFYIKAVTLLDRVQNMGYIHGSPSSWNFMVSDENYKDVNLIDFTTATKIGEKTKMKVKYDSPYEKIVHPEVIADPSFDVFEFGNSILYIELGKQKFIDVINNCFTHYRRQLSFSERFVNFWLYLFGIQKIDYKKLKKATRDCHKEVIQNKIKHIYDKKIPLVEMYEKEDTTVFMNSFSDLIMNMCDNNSKHRLNFKQIKEFLQKLYKIYEGDTIGQSIVDEEEDEEAFYEEQKANEFGLVAKEDLVSDYHEDEGSINVKETIKEANIIPKSSKNQVSEIVNVNHTESSKLVSHDSILL